MAIDTGGLLPRSRWAGVVGERELLLDAFVASVFCVIQSRSAWHGSRSTTYDRLSSYFTSKRYAERHVELRRVQGSQWRLREEPALCLEGSESSVLVVDFRMRHPPTLAPLGRRRTLKAVANAVQLNAALMGATRATGLPRFRPPARVYSSWSDGGDRPLTYYENARSTSIELAYVLDLAKAAQLHLDRVR